MRGEGGVWMKARKADAKTYGTGAAVGQGGMADQTVGKRPRRAANAKPSGGGAWSDLNDRMTVTARARAQAGRDPAGLAYGEFNMTDGAERTITGTSITDPTLCELLLRWFAPPGGIVWNPFMGESSIGIVASRLGYRYTAVDIRPEQVAANQAQSGIICPADKYPPPRWLVGDAATAEPEELCRGQVDFVLSCPPYFDLERYSDLPEDLSTMDYPEFMVVYRKAIAACYAAMKDNRFACFIVGEVRGPGGNYVGFVPDTIRAFMDAGFGYYNEAILVTAAGSLPVRTRRQFEASRKLGRTHQTVVIAVKGDAKLATAAIGPVEFGEGSPDDEAPQ
jgi:hypothetical protein